MGVNIHFIGERNTRREAGEELVKSLNHLLKHNGVPFNSESERSRKGMTGKQPGKHQQGGNNFKTHIPEIDGRKGKEGKTTK